MTRTGERAGVTLARKPAVLTAVAAAVCFVLAAGFAIPWDWVPGGDLVPTRPRAVFTAEELQRAEEYSSARRLLGWGSLLTSLAVAVALGLTPLGANLLRRLTGSMRWWLAVLVGVVALVFVGRLVTLPFSLAIRGLNLDYGLTEQALSGWMVDYLKGMLVTTVVSAILVLLVVGVARVAPRLWFAWVAVAAVVLTVAGSFLYPLLVEPLFNRFESMPSGAFRSSVFDLAAREGVDIDDVLIADASRRTTTLNAYVSGFGSTRRVVVYDNLLENLSPDEARVVIAHELAHARNDDVLVGTALGAVGVVLGITVLALLVDSQTIRRRSGTGGAADPAAVPVIVALVALGTLLSSPIQNAMSRAVEARADREALVATREQETFIDMQRELAVRSLADPTPPLVSYLWFSSHPTVLQRAGLPASLDAAK